MEEHFHKVHFKGRVGVSREQAWDAWTKPEFLSKWFTDNAIVDLKIGGRYENSDGDRGQYLRIEEPDLLSFTWEHPDHKPGSVVTVKFSPDPSGVGTEYELLHEKIGCDDERDLNEGWQSVLRDLEKFLNSNN